MLQRVRTQIKEAWSVLRAAHYEEQSRQAYEWGLTDRAVRYARLLLKICPDNPWANLVVAGSLLEKEEYAASLAHLNILIRFWPHDPSAYFAMGLCLDWLERMDEAIEYYRKALELAPDWDGALKNLGRDLYLTGRFVAAERCLRAYTRRCPDDKEAHDLLGYVCYSLGHYADSYRHYDKAMALDPYDMKVQRNARMLYRRAATS
ncbi:MAG TPA: tetratricopeptide repeat protein [Capsulimonadaceae bacterium]|nr:tetratricopeptide repeat protein [Capsulimonadaceae bacterium]